jgi:hypothetical protein
MGLSEDSYSWPNYEIEKKLKFLQIYYGYLLFKKTFWEYKPAIVRLPQSVCKCQIQIPSNSNYGMSAIFIFLNFNQSRCKFYQNLLCVRLDNFSFC